ncbi:kinesin-like protein KIN-12F [Nymphaea colorata]|nr:kinesin-like protein KIN-12F [Nymphaea colorata]
MSLATVCQTLKELFPQVDDRLLKATAFEHGDDVESAVDFIVNEVLPYIAPDTDAADSQGSSTISTGLSSLGLSFSSSEDQSSKLRLESLEDFPNLATGATSTHNPTDVSNGLSLHTGFVAFEHCAENDAASECVKASTLGEETKPDSVQNVEGVFHEERFGPSESPMFNSSSRVLKNEESCEQSDNPDGMTDDWMPIRETDAAGHVNEILNIDFLEDLINEAKKNKAILLKALESVALLMKEVDIREKEAEDAKEAASVAGSEALNKAEDLKKMLARAKEANDMQAGEVYGEKSILATEARELQSRLLHMSEERDKHLSLIDEVSRDLQARIAAVDEAKAEAEQEKLRKEECASNALAEQELIMEKVVAESKQLKEQAEKNSKLREFLIDRGRIVDMLQGELSVVCEDVKLLKERSDKGLSLSSSSFLASKLGADTGYVLSSLSMSIKSQTSSSEGRGASLNCSLAGSVTKETADPLSATVEQCEETKLKISCEEMVGREEDWDEPWELLKGACHLQAEMVQQQ